MNCEKELKENYKFESSLSSTMVALACSQPNEMSTIKYMQNIGLSILIMDWIVENYEKLFSSERYFYLLVYLLFPT